MSSAVPSSTILPAYITWMLSQCSATTPRSCVMMTTAALNSSWSRSIRSRIWAWTVTSSAVVGSSAIRRSGVRESAIAVRKDTLLPDPDSPTTPRVSPGMIEKVTPSTAFTTPSSVGKLTRRFLTSRSGSVIGAPAAVMCDGTPGGPVASRVSYSRVQERVNDVHDHLCPRDEERGDDGDVEGRREILAPHPDDRVFA